MKGQIKTGSRIAHDFSIGEWPACKPPKYEYENEEYQTVAKDPEMVFDVEWQGSFWDCRASGYGMKGNYGNGSIFVWGENSIDFIGEPPTEQEKSE